MENSMEPPAIYWAPPVTCICLCPASPLYVGASSERITLYNNISKQKLLGSMAFCLREMST